MPSPGAWDLGHAAIWIERAPGETRAIALRHPTYPYEVDAVADDSGTLTGIAAGYLQKVKGQFGLPDLFEPGTSKFSVPLTWLPVHDGDTPARPLASFWVRRSEPEPPSPPPVSAPLVDRTAVILAVQSAIANDSAFALGSRLGIRIVAHVSPSAPLKVRITSAFCSTGLAPVLGPHDPVVMQFFDSFFNQAPFRSNIQARILVALGLGSAPVWFDGLRVVASTGSHALIDVYASAEYRPSSPGHAVTARFAVSLSDPPKLERLDKWPLVAHAGPVQARLFPRDPASRFGLGDLINARPNRSPARLLKYRMMETLPGLTLGGGGDTHLVDDLDQVQVMQSKLLDPNADEAVEQTVFPGAVTQTRLNAFAALSAYRRGRELWDTMRGYGLKPLQYFKFGIWPLHVRYRATIDPGPGKDGKTVNAQVNFDPPHSDLIATTEFNPQPIQVRFALADLKRSSSRREPQGLAADPRWCWHEFGHVLLVAATGGLQFRFSHSAGDALAAILWDPGSALATIQVDPASGLARFHPVRGLTFPWVYLHRRHDRDVLRGWSWSGRYHRPAEFTTDVNAYPRKGYQSEQILSTSLFRLYRALGGDTLPVIQDPVPNRRQAAADYTAYLIMRAIQGMPPALAAPLETPDEFVTALIDADIGTAPLTAGPLRRRVGGCAYKVVRWAFEAQGLYATTNALAVVDHPGKPPDPDVFIDDARPDSEGDVPRGGYMPVPLDWRPTPTPPLNAPLWHARAEAIQVVGNQVTVKVRNRGQSPATQVTVQVRWIHWPNSMPVPVWNQGAWNSLPPSAAQTVNAWPSTQTFGPFTLPAQPAGRRLVIVAAATCLDDAANTALSTGLPCATQPTPIVDLVAGDNNLGLRVHVTS